MPRIRAPRSRPWTIRARLTSLYGAVFLVSGAIMLSVGYVLVRGNLERRVHLQHRLGLGFDPDSHASLTLQQQIYNAYRSEWIHQTLGQLLFDYVLALIVMTLISVLSGWLLAGRALAPLRAITAAARRVSGENLGERIELEGPQDELKQLADTFNGMLGRLDAAFASQRHFVANASHELRTPLAIMRTEVDVALADPDAEVIDLREMGEALRESIDRSEGLIAALLALARSETVIDEQTVELEVLAGDCVTDLTRRAVEADVSIDTNHLAPAVLRGDPALLERLLANLIDNGIRHNVPGGHLSVATATSGANVELVVANGGAVIAPDQVGSLTQPFRRLSRQSSGFGLGLSIVASVVKAHGGKLRVIAPPDGGLEVHVLLAANPTARVPRSRAVSVRP